MTTGNEVGACEDAVTPHKQQVNARLSAQARTTLAAIHERTGTNRTAIIEFALAFLLAGLDGGWITDEQIGWTNPHQHITKGTER